MTSVSAHMHSIEFDDISAESNHLFCKAICHCLDCRKITGAPYSFSFIVKTTSLDISGSPKEVSKTADNGNHVKNYFCSDCGMFIVQPHLAKRYLTKVIGTPLYGQKVKPDGVPHELTVVRAGIFDPEVLNDRKPEVEIYTDRRLAWISPIEGAGQFSGMLPLPSSDDNV